MNRRGLFKLLAGATAAAAMQVTGLMPISTPKYFLVWPKMEGFTVLFRRWKLSSTHAQQIEQYFNPEGVTIEELGLNRELFEDFMEDFKTKILYTSMWDMNGWTYTLSFQKKGETLHLIPTDNCS